MREVVRLKIPIGEHVNRILMLWSVNLKGKKMNEKYFELIASTNKTHIKVPKREANFLRVPVSLSN